MSAFVATNNCTSALHCRVCRDRKGGQSWREMIARHFDTDGTDWPCPKGRAWGYVPSRGLGDTVARFIKRVTFGRVKPCGGCRKRQRALNRLVPYPKGA